MIVVLLAPLDTTNELEALPCRLSVPAARPTVTVLALVVPILIEFEPDVSSVPLVLYCKLERPLTAPAAVIPPALLLIPPVIDAPPAETVRALDTPNVPVMLELPVTVIPPLETKIFAADVTVPVKLAVLEMVWPLILPELAPVKVVTFPEASMANWLTPPFCRSIRLPLGVAFELFTTTAAWPADGLLVCVTNRAAFNPAFTRLKLPAEVPELWVKVYW